MSTPSPSRAPLAVWILFILLLVQAIGAIGGGIALVAGPQARSSRCP